MTPDVPACTPTKSSNGTMCSASAAAAASRSCPRHGLTPRDGVPSQLSLAQIVRHIGIGRLPALAKVHGYVLSRTNVRHRRTVRRVGDATMAQWVRVRFAIDMRRVPAAGSAIHPRAAVDRHSAMPDKAAADHGGRRRGVERGAVAQRCVVASMGVRRSHARLADDLQPVDAADASQRADRPRSGVRHRLSSSISSARFRWER